MPSGHVCCGRPPYDYGFLDPAERYLRRTLNQLLRGDPAGDSGGGHGAECLAVFKDELTSILPYDDDAKRLARNAMDPEHQLLERMGLGVEPVSGGCCGLAGRRAPGGITGVRTGRAGGRSGSSAVRSRPWRGSTGGRPAR
jgi:Fe-S oxidoreductase